MPENVSPRGDRWYLADLVTEFIIAGKRGSVVHADLVLVEASSPDQAYERAMLLGKERERTYMNTDGDAVVTEFRGLRNLTALHGELENGTELAYEQFDGLEEQAISSLVSSRENLGVFSEGAPGFPLAGHSLTN
jgi:hypothetical protein